MEIIRRLIPLDKPCEEDGTIYPKDIVEEGVMHFVERLRTNNECIAGEARQPIQKGDRWQVIDPRWVSHLVKHLWIENGHLLAKVHLLGKYKEAAEAGMDWELVPRAFGRVEKGEATAFHIITVDLAYREEEE